MVSSVFFNHGGKAEVAWRFTEKAPLCNLRATSAFPPWLKKHAPPNANLQPATGNL